jgi:alkyl hydroperoxide reductase subunit AhpF
VNIEGDEALETRFAIEVPVVEVDGEVVSQGRVEIDAVRAAVNAARIASVRRAATGEDPAPPSS